MSQTPSDLESPHGDLNTASPVCSLERNWKWVAARGVIAVVFGVLALFMPLVAVVALTLGFGIFILIDGVVSMILGIRHAPSNAANWWSLILRGVLGIFAGLVVVIMPLVISITLVMFTWVMIALWGVFVGVMEVSAAVRLYREEGSIGWLLGGSGLLTVVLALLVPVVLVLNPAAGVWSMGILIGAYAIASGSLLLLLASRLRKADQARAEASASPAGEGPDFIGEPSRTDTGRYQPGA